MAVFYENRLMDQHKFEEAGELIDKLCSMNTAIVGLYNNLLACHCAIFDDGKDNWFYVSQGRMPKDVPGINASNAIIMGHLRDVYKRQPF